MKRDLQINSKRLFMVAFFLALAISVAFSLYSDFFEDELVVCIDAGHGGESIGAVYGDDERLEKDDNLKLALLLQQELKNRNAKVLMTRSYDKTVSLEKRCRIANMNNADFFVCLHRNSAENPDARGTEIWISKTPSTKETELADAILLNFDKVGISENRGVKNGYRDGNGDYYINSKTNMPSCLVELGFISNEADNKEFDENIEEYACAIADAVIEIYEKENIKKED